ncbi:MAG: DMT family transporter [Alphaproteobacteria bacterium]|nr:DMT family transporter [Alphaproteobacteria bacterium]
MIENRLAILSTSVSPKLIGAGFMLLWALSFSTAMAIAKCLSPEVDSIMLLFMRYFFGLVFFSPFVLQSGIKSFATTRPFLHLLRVISVVAAMGCTYYAYRHLPLALATSIGMTGPLFTTVISYIILKDNVSLPKWGLILIGYFGVLVMVRPHEMDVSFGVWVELFANLFAALTIVCTKILSRTEKTLTIRFYTNTVTTLLTVLVVLGIWKTPALSDMLTLMGSVAMCVFSQFCSVSALKYANPSFLAPFEYTRLCFAIPVGYLIFQETPTWWSIAGSFIIVGATYGLTRLELSSFRNLK